MFEEWLNAHFPDRAEKVLGLIRQCRGGRLNDPEFGSRMRGQGAYADLLRQRFMLAVKRSGLNRPRPRFDFGNFRGGDRQLSLF